MVVVVVKKQELVTQNFEVKVIAIIVIVIAIVIEIVVMIPVLI